MHVQETEAGELVKQVAKLLKDDANLKPPVWAQFVKTGHAKQRTPAQDDWCYIRAASILRKVHLQGPIGTEKLRRAYGSKKNKGAKPEHFYKGSGSIIRKIFQQCEKSGLIKQAQKGTRKGRILTPAGMKLISAGAKQVK